jgi:hypothetical protein
MPRRSAPAAIFRFYQAGIIAVEVLFAAEPVGASPAGLPNPNEFMEEQW